MKRIAAYHPIIKIENGDNTAAVELDMDDYYSEQEVTEALAETTGAKTAGEAVKAIEDGKISKQKSCRVLGARVVCSDESETVRLGWDDNLVE